MAEFWERNQRAELAEKMNIPPNHLSEILHRKRGVGKHQALLFEEASGKVLGYPIPMDAWLFNRETKHPAFFGSPIITESKS